APLCGKPPAFRPGPPISLSQRRLEGSAFQTTLRRLVNVQAPRKGEAFPHSRAAEPLVSTRPGKCYSARPGRAPALRRMSGHVCFAPAMDTESALWYITYSEFDIHIR